MLKAIKTIQQQWLNKAPNELNVQSLPLPENVKAIISQADKKDQKRECLILMAQMQSLLAKPEPKQIKPQFDKLTPLDSCTYLFDEIQKSEELKKLTNTILANEYIRSSSPCWGFLAKHKIIIRPCAFINILEKSKSSYFYAHYLSEIPIYKAWKNWFEKVDAAQNPDIILTHKELSNNEWDKDRLYHIIINCKYNTVDSINTILSHENELLHKYIIEHLPSKFKLDIHECLKQHLQQHPSKNTRSLIQKYFEKCQMTDDKFNEYIENAVDCFELKENRLYNRYEDFIAPPKISKFFHTIKTRSLWEKVANRFNLTVVQVFDYWDMASFDGESNEIFFLDPKNFTDVPQGVIERKYLEIVNIITDNLTNNDFKFKEFYEIFNYLSDFIRDEIKDKVNYKFIFNEIFLNSLNFNYLYFILSNKNHLTHRINLEEMIFSLNNFKINNNSRRKKYVFDKNDSWPVADYLFFGISKETAQAYLDYLLESGITDETSDRDHMILNTLRLNILMNSN